MRQRKAEMKYLTIKEVCEQFRVDRQTVDRWRKKGLPYIKVGRLVRIEEAALAEWMKKNTNK